MMPEIVPVGWCVEKGTHFILLLSNDEDFGSHPSGSRICWKCGLPGSPAGKIFKT